MKNKIYTVEYVVVESKTYTVSLPASSKEDARLNFEAYVNWDEYNPVLIEEYIQSIELSEILPDTY